MARWFKRLLVFLVALLVLAGGVYFVFGDRIAGAVMHAIVARAQQMAATRGTELQDVTFARASFDGLGAIRCDEVTGRVQVERLDDAGELRPITIAFRAATFVVDAGSPWSDRATVTVTGGEARLLGPSHAPTGEELVDLRARVDFSFSWWHPSAAALALQDEARRLMHEGRTLLPLELHAIARFTVRSKPQQVTVRAEREGTDGTRILLNRADVEELSRAYLYPLTATEIDLVARNPHRAPALLRLSEKASRAALAELARDRKFPHDAYRHVYWSWLLTHEFGAAFSEEVTNAHEIGATYEIGAENRDMDFQNNAVGRAYALAHVPESELVRRVLSDPAVIRQPPSGTRR